MEMDIKPEDVESVEFTEVDSVTGAVVHQRESHQKIADLKNIPGIAAGKKVNITIKRRHHTKRTTKGGHSDGDDDDDDDDGEGDDRVSKRRKSIDSRKSQRSRKEHGKRTSRDRG